MRTSILACAAISIGLASCFSVNPTDGAVKCLSGNRPCPQGYFCGGNGYCYQNGHTPPSSAGGTDMATPTAVDMSMPDMTPAPKIKGTACSSNGECLSKFCTDGYCCDQACGGQCQACDVSPGTCTVVTGAPHGGRTACSGSGACAATCNGTALSCAFPDATMSCGTQTCGGAPPTITYAATCNGSGQCVPTGGTMSSPCPVPANGTAVCAGNQCSYTCNLPYTKIGTGCGAVFQPESAGTGGDIYSVWGSSSAVVYLGGRDTANSTYLMLSLNVDGKTWSSVTMPNGTPSVTGIWGDSSSDIYAVSILGYLYHSTGGNLFSQSLQSGIFDGWHAVWGSGLNNDVWAVGLSTASSPSARVIRHSNAAGNNGWGDETSGISGQISFLGVWGGGDQDIYAVTDDGRILHTNGNGTWGSPQQFTNNNTKPLHGIWGSDSSHIYSVGDTGTILFSTGNGQWAAQTSGTTVGLRAVWGSGPTDIYIVGQMGTILHSAGDGKWVPQTSNVTPDLLAIWGSGPTNIYAVGNGGTVTHFHQ